MSTEFVASFDAGEDDWDAVRFVRFAGGHPAGPCFEFGHWGNFAECVAIAEMGFEFVSVGLPCEDPGFGTPAWFRRIRLEGRAVCGRFPITVAIGSEAHRRLQWPD